MLKTSKILKFGLVAALIATLAMIVPLATHAQDVQAKDVIKNHVEKIGGKEALEKVTSIVSTGKMEIPQAGLEGDITMYQTTGKYLMVISIEGLGEIKQGTDGKTYWEISPQGDRVLKGKEMEEAKNNATPFPALMWISDFDGEIKLVETVEEDGKTLHKVEFAPAEGFPTTRFFDKDTGLVVRTETTRETSNSARFP